MKRRALFIGDSLIEFFDWQARFPKLEVINAGRAGETAQELLLRLVDYQGDSCMPDLVVIMIGANNVVLEDYGLAPVYEKIMATCAARFPNSLLVACGLPPFPLPWLSPAAVTRLNDSLRSIVENHHGRFLDLSSLFNKVTAGKTGRCFLEDDVHLSDLGYAIWSEALQASVIRDSGGV